MWITLSGNRPMKDMMQYTSKVLKDQFSTIDGVGEVSLGGFMEPNLRVWLDAGKMREKELTVDDVVSAISSEHSEVPAGYISTGKNEMNIRVAGEAETVKEFTSIVIPARKGSPLWKTFHIGDVAVVEDGTEDVRRISRADGVSAVSIGIRKQRGTNSVQIAKAVRAKMEAIKKYVPSGMNLDVRYDSTKFIEESMREMYFVLILSVLLTGLVCWFFLGSFSSALNVFLTIPMSLCGSFFVIYVMGFTLNTFTLLGLSLVVGIVVDDAIMMLENIVRHRELGETRVKAAIKGAREITFAAIAASVAILAIFVPVIFMSGVIGRYFFQFGVTISVAVAISLLGALTLTPMFGAQFLSIGHTTGMGKVVDNIMNFLRNKYGILLAWCLKHRWYIIVASLIIFFGSLLLFKSVKREFVPPQDLSMLSVRMQTKPGTALEITDGVFKQAEQILSKLPFVDSYFDFIGGSSGNIMITLKKLSDRPIDAKKKRSLTQQELMPVVRKALKDIPEANKVVVQDPSLLGLSTRRGYPIEFTVSGLKWEKLVEYSNVIEKEMVSTELMSDIDSDYDQGPPEIQVLPDRRKAAERGVSISVIGQTINALIGGVRAGKYTHDGRRYDIRLQLVSKDRSNPDDISKIWVRNNRGEIIRLSEVVTIVEKPAQLSITRNNRERAIRMFANVAPGKSQAVAMDSVEKIGKKVLPEGYKLVFSGSAQTFQESFTSLYLVLFLGIFVAYMVLGIQFNSFVHPFNVLLALPFSI